MTAKVSEKSITARWLQAIVITCVMYLVMGMNQSESTSSTLYQWRSAQSEPESLFIKPLAQPPLIR
ncbi:hypothetical protein [Leptolyngbya ohadii]|uniref:hypothetical protein n=1 Tax=Leptolyngbya ohadii TaxID=1962290 RepID=UPI000B59F57A|nr:hypothetical protein [Leptolyngbya ohadii]